MTEKLNKFKQTVKDHRTEIIAISIATVAVGVVVARAMDKRPRITLSDGDTKMILAGDAHLRFDTKYGSLVLKPLIEN